MTRSYSDFGIEVPPGSGEVKVRCPRCSDSRKPGHQREKDLSVNRDKGAWNCWHCGYKGGLTDTPKWQDRVAYSAPTPLVTALTAQERLYAWFEARGISRATVDACHVTTHATDKGVAIAFRHYRDGTHVHTAFRALSTRKVCWQDTGTERIFYGLDDVQADHRMVIITEGHPDKLAWYEAVPNVPALSVPDGAGVGDGKMSYLTSAADLLERMERVYLAMDADTDGQKAMHELARRIGIEKCFVVRYPESCKDANDVLRQDGGADLLKGCLDDAQPYPVAGIYRVSDDDVFAQMDEYVLFGAGEGYTSHFENLNRLYRPDPGTVTVWTGISGHGKSTFLNHYLLGVAKQHDCPFALFTPENMPPYKFLVKLAEILLRKRSKHFASGELDLVRDFMARNCIVVYPEDGATLDRILAMLRTTVLRYGVKMCVIDPYNMLESVRPRDMSETEYISEVMTKLGNFAKSTGTAVHLVAHPAKYQNYTGKEQEPKPGLNDISSSGNFRNKADFGIVVYRDIYDDTVPTEVMVQKVRDDDFGTTGSCWFTVDVETRTITPAEGPTFRKHLTVMARNV